MTDAATPQDDSFAKRAFDRQRAAMAVEGLSAPAMHVLLVLCVMANDADRCWPPVRGPKGLAAKTGLSERTVVRALRSLEDAGHISTCHFEGRGSQYTVHPCHSDTPASPSPVAEEPTPATVTRAPVSVTPKQPITTNSQKTSSSSRARARVPGRPVREARLPKPASLTAEPPPDLPPGVSPEQWADYVEMRRAMPKSRPFTPAAARGIARNLSKLAAAGHDPGAALEQSVMRGWTDVYPLKDQNHGSTLRGSRPDPAIDLLYAARRAQQAEGISGDGGDDLRDWDALPSERALRLDRPR